MSPPGTVVSVSVRAGTPQAPVPPVGVAVGVFVGVTPVGVTTTVGVAVIPGVRVGVTREAVCVG